MGWCCGNPSYRLRIFVDLACQKTLTKRSKWKESDPEPFKRRQHNFFRLPPPERVLALRCGDPLNRVCATDSVPKLELIPRQPSPIADTSRLPFPSLGFCIVSPSRFFFLISKAKVKRCGTCILILPIRCRFIAYSCRSLRFRADLFPIQRYS